MPKNLGRALIVTCAAVFLVPATAFGDPPANPTSSVAVGSVRCPAVGAKDPAKDTAKEAGSRVSCTEEAKAGITAGLLALPAPAAKSEAPKGFEVSANVEKASVKGGEGTAHVALLVKERGSQRLVAVVHASASVRGGTGKEADLLRVAIRRAAETAVQRSAPVLGKTAKK